jgi:rhodanese-related sulfurtransferase
MSIKVQQRSKKSEKSRLPEWVPWAIGGGLVVLAVLALFLILARLGGGSEPDGPLGGIPPEVSVDDAYILLSRDATFVDIRPADEWDAFHIDTSLSIPLEELSGRLDEIPTDALVVVVDRGGESSARARDQLLAAGFRRVTTVTGGIQGWTEAGYPVLGTVPY